MTRKEVAEIFSLMMMAWPNAKMFERGLEGLGQTIELWTACTSDIDFWTAQRATIKLCKECKFPPSIAEFRERAEKVSEEINGRISAAWRMIRSEAWGGRSNQDIYDQLPADSLSRKAIDLIGGPDALSTRISENMERWNYEEWERACRSLLRNQTALPGTNRPGINGAKQIGGRQK